MKLLLAAFLALTPLTVFAETAAQSGPSTKPRFAVAQTQAASDYSLSADVNTAPLTSTRLYVGWALPLVASATGPEVSALFRLKGTSSYFGPTVSFIFAGSDFLIPIMATYQYRVETLGIFHPYFGFSMGAVILESGGTSVAFAAAPRVGFEFSVSEAFSFYVEPKATFLAGSGGVGLMFFPMTGITLGL